MVLVRRPPATWWLRNKKFLAYVLRELSALFMALYAIAIAVWLTQLGAGEPSFSQFSRVVWSPLLVVISVIALGFSLYHSLTWFELTSKAQPIQLGEMTVDRRLVFVGNVAVWLAISYIVIYLFLR